MVINNRLYALIFRILLLAVGFAGVIAFLVETKSPGILKYFSVVSAILNLVFYIYLTMKTAVELHFSGKKGSTMLDVRLRGFLISGVLASLITNVAMSTHTYGVANAIADFTENYSLAGILIKLVFPLMVLADWLLFTRKFKFRCRQAFIWILYPVSFFAVHLIRSALQPGADYVYYFLDFRSMGIQGVISSIIIIAVLFLIANLIFILFDTFLGDPPVVFSWSTENDN